MIEITYEVTNANIKNLLLNYHFNHVGKFLTLPRLCFIIAIELILVLKIHANENIFADISANFILTT